MASSSFSVNIQAKHDVFLSFRGEDTRHNITSHIYSALIKKGIAAFIDDDGLERGDPISPALSKAIEESMISVIIFSKDYAASRWCLEELAKIIECKNTNGQIVIPVFYYIDPSDVRKQSGSFRKAFVEHEKRFKETPEKVESWRAALAQVADLSGYHATKDWPESKFVDEIVGDILKKLLDKSPLTGDCDGLVGINSHIEQIKSLLSKSQVLGIWGMGGIGKTTIAEIFFSQISRKFVGCCFIENVREELEKYGGRLVHLQQRIINKILEENHVFDTTNTIPQLIKNRVQGKNVLIVLDDVNDSRILESLIGGLKPLGQESKIIITTRDKQVLLSYGVDNIYEVEGLNHEEALLLFCKHAFKQNHPVEDLQQLSYKITEYVRGNPLAIRVVGSTLCGKSKEQWDSIKDNLEIIGGTQIYDILKISFDALQDIERRIFLDISCFFKGENEHFAKKILEACYPTTLFHLDNLINKSLVKISNNKLEMHDLLQEMGRRIVYQESKNNPGKRSRLWHNDDVYDVLQNNKGTEVVESILFNMSRSKELHLSSEAFVNMTNLRLLKFYKPYWNSGDQANISNQANIFKVCLTQGLKYLSNNLRYLHWDGYPFNTLPSEFSPEKLVALQLPYGNIQNLDKTKHFSSLIGHLNHTIFEACQRLLKVPPPIQSFTNLQFINMRECATLRRFSRNIHFTSSVTIDLSYCLNLTEFPQISGNVKNLTLDCTAIKEIPSSISSLPELVELRMFHCRKLKRISTSICKLKSLLLLDFNKCLKLQTFPEIMEEMKGLRILYLSQTGIKELPSSIENLTEVEYLVLEDCEHLETLPRRVGNLQYLKILRASGTTTSQLPSFIACFNMSSSLWNLDLSNCNLTEFPEVICSLSSLKELDVSKNNFKSLSKSIKQLFKLRSFCSSNCNMLQSIPELPLSINTLRVDNCKRLGSLPEPPSNVEELDHEDGSTRPLDIEFNLNNCLNLNENISPQRIQRMATALRLYYGKVPEFCYTLPGSEIPNWFRYQNYKSFITIELPQQYCCNRRLIGFALSIVVTFDKGYDGSRFYYDCELCYGKGNKVCYICRFFGSMESDHIAIGFIPCMDVRLLECQRRTTTFEFHASNMTMEGSGELKCCGVCPIYEEPNTSIEQFASIHEDLRVTTPVDCSKASESGDGRASDEEL